MSAPQDLVRPPGADGAEPPVLVLRVFGGRLDGAEQRVTAGAVRVGHGFDNDLVLRGRRTKNCSVTVRLDGAQAHVRLLSGSASLLGVALTEQATALLPQYVPLTIGEFAIAIGEPDSPRWADVRGLVASAEPPASGAAEPRLEDETGEAEAEPSGDRRAGMGGWLKAEGGALGRRASFVGPGGLLAASAALLAIAFAGPAYRMVEARMTTPTAVSANLSAAGYRDLQVRADPVTRGLVIEGRVADEAAVEKLRRFANEHYARVSLNVTTATAAAAAVTELLQAQGIDAEAQPGRAGLVVRSEYLPRDRMAALQARIRRDLPQTGPLRFVVDEARGPRDLQYFFASDKFGLASLVDGNPGHIVTADGQYWFAGALLPTGHRLLSVGNGAIRFERDGMVESLQVSSPGARAAPAAPPSDPLPTTTTETATTMAGLVGPVPRSRT